MLKKDWPKVADLTSSVVVRVGEYVLLIKRKNEPFKGCWALPGGYLELGETFLEAAQRELQEETGLYIPKESFNPYPIISDTIDRDPRGRVIDIVFLVDLATIPQIEPGDDAVGYNWYLSYELPAIAFDHKEAIEKSM